MNRHVAIMASMVLGAAVFAQPAEAQLNGLPVYFNPRGGSGLMLAVDYGRGVNDDAGKANTFAARASLGIGPFSLGGGIGASDVGGTSGDDYELQYMGNAALRIFGGGLLPVSLSVQAGIGILDISDLDTKLITFPIGIGLGINVPTPVFSFDPWIAGRYTLHRNEIGTMPRFDQNAWGVSGGVDLNFLMGLGLHVSVDWESISEETTAAPFTGLASKPFVFGIGLHYVFTIPGLPGVPIVPGI
ncbi:MAG: hypothetical protein O7I93_14955 [Gemmatimonadetes bacterium]|nr:hypothetical protein [Gemmatimonadota bacterium]